MEIDRSINPVRIGPSGTPHVPLGFGGSWFVPYNDSGDEDKNLLDAMQAAYDNGITHFDTAVGYGNGHSEELYGQFLKSKRERIFLTSKADIGDLTAAYMLGQVESSLRRLQTDFIDLYYIHWPRSGLDMRPAMEGLEQARAQGKIRAVGVSNFSVEQMQQVQEVGTLDAYQIGYNLLWRYPEAQVIPFCIEHQIAVVTYSSLAHGILTGKFARDPGLRAADQRHSILPFRADIWPYVYEGVEQMKALAAEINRPLMHLAIRWLLNRRGVTSVLIGGRNREQAEQSATALAGTIPNNVFDRLTDISDEIMLHVPDAGNLFNYYP